MAPPMDEDCNLLEAGLVEQTLAFVRRNTPVTAVLEDGARRVEEPRYPDEVTREAVVNALIHRDYLLANTDTEVALYEDRLEIISPGRLASGITPERMRAGTRASRNQLLKDVLGLRLSGAHRYASAPEDCPGHAGAQRDGPGLDRGERAIRHAAVRRANGMSADQRTIAALRSL